MHAKRFIVLIVSLILLHSSWGPQFKFLCNPVLACHGCALSWFACPIGVFIHYSGWHSFPFLAIGTVLLVGVLIGRLLCGWICPFGFLQEILYKIPTPKFELPRWTAAIKYPILFFLVFYFPYKFGELTMFSFCRICPAGTLESAIPAYITSGFPQSIFSILLRLGALLIVLFLVIGNNRSFCKIICPIGTILGILNKIAFWQVPKPQTQCISCKKCDKACPTSISPSTKFSKQIPVNRDINCILCYECVYSCPETDQIDKKHR